MRRFLFVVTLLLLAATTILLFVTQGTPVSQNQPVAQPAAGEVAIGGAFTLTDQDGNKAGDSQFRGKLMLVFFGFTRCPDECPTAATAMSAAESQLAEKADQVAPLFISVDPAYDTPAVLKEYLTHFDSHFVGLTGTKEEVRAVSDIYRSYYDQGGEGKQLSHSAYIYLMGRDGKYLAHFPYNASPKEIVDAITPYLE